MYYILKKGRGLDKDEVLKYEGDYPHMPLVELLENDEQILIISTYSNTVKVPFINKEYHSYNTKSGYEWDFYEFDIPEVLKILV
jgi:hypothetical protein